MNQDQLLLNIAADFRLAVRGDEYIDFLTNRHIAFQVKDVPGARQEVLRSGGKPVGEVVTTQTADGRRVTWCYVTDPEGNIVELQAWE